MCDDLVKVPNAADEVDFQPTTIRSWCRAHEGRFAVKIGGQWRIYRDALDNVKSGTPLSALPSRLHAA